MKKFYYTISFACLILLNINMTHALGNLSTIMSQAKKDLKTPLSQTTSPQTTSPQTTSPQTTSSQATSSQATSPQATSSQTTGSQISSSRQEIRSIGGPVRQGDMLSLIESERSTKLK